jgi:NADPH-dependent 2,4-dienoyl-CoA reductase/sulfur reductase-like enzyme
MGTGVRPATGFLKDSGIELNSDGGVICDPFLQTSVKDVFAAGDIASHPYWPTGKRIRTEHWITSLNQGTYAAFNMMNKFVPYGLIPFFWSRFYNKGLHFVGTGAWKEVYITGDVSKGNFVAYYINENDKVVSVASMSNPKATLTFLEAMQQNVMPSGTQIKNGSETWESVAGKLKQNTGGAKCQRANCCQKKSII